MSLSMIHEQEQFRGFDPVDLRPEQRDLIDQLCRLNQSDPVVIKGYTNFCIACHLGFRNITYAGHLASDDASLVWITNEHARMFAKALRAPMQRLCFQFTTFEGPGFLLMAAELDQKISIGHFIAAHKSGDEASVLEAKGLAELVTKARSERLSWWAANYDLGTVDTFVNELERLENRRLKHVDVCDLTIPEPNDKVEHVGLENLLERNRG